MGFAMLTIDLPDGEPIPALGQGTWALGERRRSRAAEIAALRAGVELGMTLIDTAEMYGDGESESLLSEALVGLREQVFLVSKVYPHHADRRGVREACERSLRRLGTEQLDLYLLHWRGSVPLAETVEAFNELREAGKIRHWGVSNFDLDDMQQLMSVPGGSACAVNQVLYNVARRGPEFDLLPWLRERRIATMAYSPVDHGRLPASGALARIAQARQVPMLRVALAWLLRQPGVCAIPKASSVEHVRDNALALELDLDAAELAAIDAAFKPPHAKVPLEML
jgi:diketogulonate reductase-like aldo/keto reductase